jgi:O-antigen/teichoic acid export membrane protein
MREHGPAGRRKWGRDYVLYGAGSAARQIASVVMLPIYTRYLSPADYGAVEICSLIVACMSLIAGLSLGEGIFRHFHTQHGPRVVSTALLVGVFSNGLGAIVLFAAAPVLAGLFLGGDYSPTLLALFALTLVAECCSSIPMCHMRVDGRAVLFFWVGILRLVLNVAFNVYFVIFAELGPLGVVYGALASTTIVALVALPYTLARIRISWSHDAARALVRFGLPLSLANIAVFYLASADRFFLEHFFSLAQVGVYALAARLAQGFLLLFYEPFGQVWDAEKYRIWQRHRSVEPVQSVFRLLCANLLLGGAVLSIFAPEIFAVLATDQFARAADLAPILIAAAILTSLSMFARLGSLVADQTRNVNRSAWISAVALTVLAIALVPSFGAMGAALAVLGGAAVRAAIENHLASKAQDFSLPWGSFVLVAIVMLAVVTATKIWSPSGAAGIAAKALIALVLIAGAWWSPLVRTSDRQLFLRVVRSW